MYLIIYTSIQDKLQFCMLCLRHVSEMFVAAKRFQVSNVTPRTSAPISVSLKLKIVPIGD